MVKKTSDIATTLLLAVFFFMALSFFAFSATTISTDINTGGSLTVSGNSTLGRDLTVDTSTLYVDSTNNRVGIGTTTPAEALDVNGRIMLEQTSAPGVTPGSTADRLYNVSGNLFWNGTDLSNGSSKWTSGTATDIYRLNGNIGIGTTTPNWNLQVAGTRPFLTLSDINAGLNSKHWFLSSQGGSFHIGTSTDALGATSTYFTIASNGNIGINTSNPTEQIHAQGANLRIRLTSTGAKTSTGFIDVLANADGSARLAFSDASSGGKRYDLGSGVNGGGGINSAFPGSFYIVQNSNGWMRLVILGSSGNVGIGTTTPNWKFQIAAARPFLTLSDTSGGTDLKHWYLSSQGGNFYVGTTTDSYATTTNKYQALAILKNSNVGIGTPTPAAALDVNGYASVLQTSTTTECSAAIAGSIFFNQANSHFWTCDSTNWLRLDN